MANYNNKKLALCLILPQLIITLIFFIWPAFQALSQSFFFTDAYGLHSYFAGLDNFVSLFKDSAYAKAVWITFLTSIAITFLTMALGLFLAALLAKRQKSLPFYKTLFLIPYAIAPAIAAILWRFFCQPDMGWLPRFLSHLGYDFNYLIYPKQALLVIILAASWQQFSYNFLFFFAGLKAIPNSLIEAAILDGASGFARFWQIIFPLLSPTTFFLLVVNLIYAFFDTFGIIDIMTHGGPANSTTTLIYKIYKDGFIGMDLGGAAAQSILLMFIVIILSLIQFRYLEKKVHYE